MLNKIFSDPHLPQELGQYRSFCLSRFYRKIKAYAEDFLRLKDQDAYDQVMQILRREGFHE